MLFSLNSLFVMSVFASGVLIDSSLSRMFRTSSLKKNRFTQLIRSSLVLQAHSSHSATCTQDLLIDRVKAGLVKAFGDEVAAGSDALLLPAKPEHGDYQCNAALPLAKRLKLKPREVAEKLKDSLEMEGILASMDISGPGFINMKLSDSYVQNKIVRMLSDKNGRLGISPVAKAEKVVVDFSSPNIAKEMHVGHLRSTIIGDTLSRILEFLGHNVKRLNHVGDWGTQFGMLIHYMNENRIQVTESGETTGVPIGDLVQFYKQAKKRFDEDLVFQEAARKEVVKLQSGDPQSTLAWKAICALSRQEFQKIYDLLNVKLEERGESFYNSLLPHVVSDLEASGRAVESQGATCIFLPNYTNPDGTPMPLIIKKSDGAYLYSTTDLAAVRQRVEAEKADRCIYVVDVGQSMHFQMVFEAAKAAGFARPETRLTHVPFGLVLGEDGKKFKTRSGDTVRLKDLLDEAVRSATEDMRQRIQQQQGEQQQDGPPELTDEQMKSAQIVGIGAVKYADLSMNRESNYRFSYKKMLSLNGNTAPYMLYAYVRIQGIRRKAAASLSSGSSMNSSHNDDTSPALRDLSSTDLIFKESEEVALAKQLMQLDEVLLEVEKDLYPNRLCDYLFELSGKFNTFYERCPVLKAENPQIQKSRAALCALTADVLKLSLGLLGIDTVEKL